MKNASVFGFIAALASAFLTLILYFLGFHSDPSKLGTAGWIGGLLSLVISVTCTVLGVKAERGETEAGKPFGFGSALKAGMLVTVVATILNAAFTFLYWVFINPGFADVVVQSQMAKFEASGMSGDKLEKAEAMTRKMASPLPQAVVVVIAGVLFGLLISLVVAAIMKRSEPDAPPTL